MNQRDFTYVEDRCYGDVRAMEAAARLQEAGEVDLAAKLTAIVQAQTTALSEFRAALRDRWIEEQRS